jgi:hypothetical protein
LPSKTIAPLPEIGPERVRVAVPAFWMAARSWEMVNALSEEEPRSR